MFQRSRGTERDGWPTDNVVPFRSHRHASKVHVAARKDDDASSASSGSSKKTNQLLSDEQLHAIESAYPHGLTAVQIVDAFTRANIKFSEASFRKYVQQGLLPRSRRVGRKGKHKGSLGVYPAKTVRRINDVKQLMLDGYTIEEIQGQILLYTDLIEGVAESLAVMWPRLDEDSKRLEPSVQRELHKDMSEARRNGEALVEKLGDIARRIAAPRTDHLRLAGAAGGAEDLF